MSEWFLNGDYALAPTNYPALILALLLSFAAGHVISWMYMLTHSGLSYSKTFVNSLLMIPTTVALVMSVIQNSLIMAFGLMAVFAIVRFRTILRDTLDTTYILAVIAVGMACGTQKYATAIIGTILFVIIMFYIGLTSFGSRHKYDLILNLRWARPLSDLPELLVLLERHSLSIKLASQRTIEAFEGADISYRLLLRDPNRVSDLINEVKSLPGVQHVTGLQASDESEM
jgi:hypothetical protein